MAGYTRNDTANNIADGNVINASDLDGEFDAVQAAFNGTTGHSHDGTSGNGPQIATSGLADNAVTTAKITDANVTLAKMAANSVDSDQYVDGSIDRVHLAADIVDGTKIADDSIDSEHYVDGSIDTAHIADDAVTSAKLDTNIQIAGTLGVTGETTLTTHLNMGDSDKIKLGDSADLEIYHDGSHSYISDVGTGHLILMGGNLFLREPGGGNFIGMTDGGTGGTVTLYHNNSAKLATKSDGVDITGELQSDSLDVDGNADISGNLNMSGGGNIDLADSAQLRLGASQDLLIYHDGSHSRIDDTGTGNLILRGNAAISLQKYTGEVLGQFTADGAVELYYDNASKLATKSDGVDITGELQADSLDIDGDGDISGTLTVRDDVTLQGATPTLTFTDTDSNCDSKIFSDGGTGNGTLILSADHNGEEAGSEILLRVDGSDRVTIDSSGNTTITGDLDMNDNDTIKLGTGDDLRLYHDGSNSYIDSNGSGVLFIRQRNNDQDIRIQSDDAGGGEATYIQCDGSTGVVTLNYYGSTKLSTKTDGVDITGELQSDSLDVDGNADISGTLTMGGNVDLQDNDYLLLGASDDLQIYHDANNSYITHNTTGNLYIRQNRDDGDIFIQSDNGSGGATNYLTADGSTGKTLLYQYGSEKLRTESDGIYVTGNVQSSAGRYEGADGGDFILVGASQIDFYINNSNEFRMESDGDFHADANVIAHSTTVSDERLKENIEKIENATDKVSQLNGYTFNYKKDGRKGAGVIAQEVEKVLPSAVMEKQLPLKMDDGVAYKIVEYDQIIGLLIESIKELKQEISTLKGE